MIGHSHTILLVVSRESRIHFNMRSGASRSKASQYVASRNGIRSGLLKDRSVKDRRGARVSVTLASRRLSFGAGLPRS